MATDKDIWAAGSAHLLNMDDIDPALIAWPGKDFDPPSSATPHLDCWFEMNHFPNEPNDPHWGNDAEQEYIGFFQVQVFFRPGNGIMLGKDQAELIQAHFKKGTELGPVKVSKKPWMSPHVVDGANLYIPVTIPYLGSA